MTMLLGMSRDEWVARYDKPKTRDAARDSLKKFDVFLAKITHSKEQEVFEDLRSKDEVERYFFLDRMVQNWKGLGLAPATIQTYLGFVRSWLKFNRLKTDNDTIKDYVKVPKRSKERRKPLSRETIQMFLERCNPFYRAFFLVLSCTGMRLNELLTLRPMDIDTTASPPKVTIRHSITKTDEERITFLTPEAWKYLQPIMKDIPPDHTIFDVSKSAVEFYMGSIRRALGLTAKYANGKNYHLNIHRFRSFCETQLSNGIGEEFAHAILGHGGYLKQYYGTPDEEMGKMYAGAYSKLTINDSQRYKDEAEMLKEKLDTHDDMKEEIEKLKAEMARIRERRN